ncbi:peptide-methionine (S)-S-oxide reductase MsrA [Sphingomonas sp. RB1R13]|uniref:peptide-methionine (S)-S-oxide reductase MsrA n=1 Tax=Sphingomonas sp. RB1R13 TaxID=3096159 RepID=UPI002FCA0917
MKPIFAPLAILGALTAAAIAFPATTAATVMAPRPVMDIAAVSHRETAVFAGGCFWGVEGVYSHVKGVISATSGYSGGSAATATYGQSSTGRTGHAESVRVVFDPTVVSYGQLLRIYFSVVADPTLKDAQGPDRGTQYRSALFPLSPAQARVARAYIGQLAAARVFPRPIVTTVEPFRGFYPAEAEHQRFMARNPDYPYIVVNDRPKVDALRRQFAANYRA